MISDKDFNDLKRSVEIVQRKVARVDGDPIILASPGKRFDLNDHLNVVKLKLGIANLKEYAENSNNALGNHNHGKGTVNTLTKYLDINGNICDSVMHENDGKIGVNIVPKSAFHVNNPDPVDTFLQVTNGVTGSSDSLDGMSLGVLADGSSAIRTSYSRELAFLFEGSDEGMPLFIDKAASIALSTRTNHNPYTLRLNGRIAVGMMVDEPEDNLQVHGPFNSFVRITTDAVGITDGFVLGTDGSMRSVMRGGYQGHIYIQDESTPGVFDNVIDFDPRESTIRIDGNEVLHAGNTTLPNQELNTTSSPTFAGVTVGPTPIYSSNLYLGGWNSAGDGLIDPNKSTISVSNGNIHIEPSTGMALHLNYYKGGPVIIGSIAAPCTTQMCGTLNLGGSQEPYLAQSNNSSITWGVHSAVPPNQYMLMTQFKPYTNALGVLSTYSRLQLNWHTGIEIGAQKNYGGTRFFNDAPAEGGTQIMSIGDGDDNVRINSDLFVGGSSVVKLNASNNGAYFQGGTWSGSGGSIANVGSRLWSIISANVYLDVNDLGLDGFPIEKAIATGNATQLIVNGLNSKLQRRVVESCVAGQAIPVGSFYDVYDTGNLTPAAIGAASDEEGACILTLNGTTTTLPFKWKKIGNVVFLSAVTSLLNVGSTINTIAFSPLPVNLRPVGSKYSSVPYGRVTDGGDVPNVSAQIFSDTLTFLKNDGIYWNISNKQIESCELFYTLD